MIKIKKTKKGLTLVELIVTVALLAIVTAAVVTGVVVSQAIIADNNRRELASARAREIADDIVECLKGVDTEAGVSMDLLKNIDATYVSNPTQFPLALNDDGANQFQYTLEFVSPDVTTADAATVKVRGTKIRVAAYSLTKDKKPLIYEAFTPATNVSEELE